MAFRKKLITPKSANQPAVLVRYAKRHRVFVKKLVSRQLTQQTLHDARYRRNGEFLFFSQGAGIMTPNQLEAIRRILLRKMYRLLKIWMKLKFSGMITSKPKEVRMGKGKGSFVTWCKPIEVGSPIFEISFTKTFPYLYLFYIFQRFRAKFTVRLWLNSRTSPLLSYKNLG
jgi:ribosomal protein L16/L10AE